MTGSVGPALRVGSLFSGYGGLDRAAESVFDGRTIWHVELDPHASTVLALRWPGVPNLGDITEVSWTPPCETCGRPTDLDRSGVEVYECHPCRRTWPCDYFTDHLAQPIDVLVGGFPCQDISYGGLGAGIKEGTRSGLWYRYADAIRVLRPSYVLVENVGALVVRGLDVRPR